MNARWEVEYASGEFERFVRDLPPYEQAVLRAAIENVLAVHGPDVCSGEWGRPLGGGLYEFRVGKSLDAILKSAGVAPGTGTDTGRKVLLRIFCAFQGTKVILLLHGYDKGRDVSARRQQREIARARAALIVWRRERSH